MLLDTGSTPVYSIKKRKKSLLLKAILRQGQSEALSAANSFFGVVNQGWLWGRGSGRIIYIKGNCIKTPALEFCRRSRTKFLVPLRFYPSESVFP